MEMTKKRLELYRNNIDEIKELQEKLKRMETKEEKEKFIESDTILDYKKGYPLPQAVMGYNYKKEWRTRQRYKKRIEELQQEQEEIEEWIFSIEDGKTQRIFRLRYLDGMRQQRVAQRVHMAQSGISKKIDEYLDLQNQQNLKLE